MKRLNLRGVGAALLCLALCAAVACPALADGAASGVLERMDDWVIVPAGTTVYRDPELTLPWTVTPHMLARRVCELNAGCTVLANGARVGYVRPDDLEELGMGVRLYAVRDTRAYQRPSTSSRWVKVREGTVVELLAVRGSCAWVRREGVTGYMNIAHLRPIGEAVAV